MIIDIESIGTGRTDVPRVLVSAHDGKSVALVVVDDEGDYASVGIGHEQARELASRLMQAAELADPNHATRFPSRF